MLQSQRQIDGPALTQGRDGLAGFQAAISETYFPYEVTTVGQPAEFRWASAACRLGPLQFSRTYVSSPFSGGRRPLDRDHKKNSYVLMLVEQGSVHFGGSLAAVVNSGELILVNADRPLESAQKVGGISLAVSIPDRLLKLLYPDPDDWCLMEQPIASGSAEILRTCLCAYWRMHAEIHPQDVGDLVLSLLHMIGAAFRNRGDQPALDSRSMSQHFFRIRAAVAEHLEDPELSADLLSDLLGISKSYLFTVMHEANTTLGRYILEQRLQRTRALLADPSTKCQTISEIAFSTGFQDLSHFSRSFSARFGKSPRAFRASAHARLDD